jgi:uncharacterized glyoxalase superfamily protein PhnB
VSNLENLKKQAKALVRLHRERSHQLACVARETLPKFAHMTDRQVLAAEFKLADAQALVARQNGCASWAALKAKADAGEPAEAPSPFGPGVLCAVPMLYVADIRRALAWWEGVAGFEAAQVSGDPPFFAEVWRGGAKIALRLVHGQAIDPAIRARETMLLQAMVRVGDIKALFLELLAAGAVFETPLQRDAFGPQFFTLKDPDGNLIYFGEPGPGSKARALAERGEG